MKKKRKDDRLEVRLDAGLIKQMDRALGKTRDFETRSHLVRWLIQGWLETMRELKK